MRIVVFLALVSFLPAAASAQRDRPSLDTLRPSSRFKAATFDLTKPRMRDSLKALIASHRDAWRATNIRNYRILLQSSCFCPGPLGWMMLEVKDGKVAKLSGANGKKLLLNDDTNLTVDRIFTILDRSATEDDGVEVAFDSTSHFPRYVMTDYRHGLPDDWWILDVRSMVVTKAPRAH